MDRKDWFRNTEWSPTIEHGFEKRLRRSRQKSQYLKIQAWCLAGSRPDIALQLIHRYFSLGESIFDAEAHCIRARAYVGLGNTEAAVESFEAALERECVLPNVRTSAYIELPVLVAARKLSVLYPRALKILDLHQSEPNFPTERYRLHGARALICHEMGEIVEARASAKLALAAAADTRSGFRYHSDLGLVRDLEDEFGQRVRALVEQVPGPL